MQPKLTISAPGDRFEREADAVADRVMGMPDPVAQMQGTSTSDASAPGPSDEEKPQIRRKENSESGTGEAASEFTSHLGGGAPLDTGSRSFFEPRFGHDFGDVRIHNGSEAATAAASIQARAFTLGRDVVFAVGQHDPGSERGKRLLAHELTHVVQQSPQTVFRDEDPAAVLPTQDQRDRIMEIFNPQQSAGDTPAVDDPAAFKKELMEVGEKLRVNSLPGAEAIRDAPVVLSETDLTDVTAIAEAEVRNAVGAALSPGADLKAVRDRIKYIPTDPGTSPAAGEAMLNADQLSSLDVSGVRIRISQSTEAQKVISDHHVLPGGRDKAMYNEVLQAIVDSAPAAWRTIALTFRGWNTSVATMVQRRIVPDSGESDEQARRRGRWLNLGTSIHEMLHAVTNSDFNTAIRGLEQADLGIEGFTEFFTRRIYADIVSRAASDAALRLRIEGVAGPAFTPPPRTSYSNFLATVTDIFDLLGGNIENMRQAYFGGHVEFLGLGPWNTLAHNLPLLRGNAIGAGILFEAGGGSLEPGRALVRADYGHLIWGYSGSVQVDLRAGGGLTYLSEGERLGIGPQASLTLRGSHLFLEGGALLVGSIAASGPVTPRLDTLLGVGAGVQFGRLQVGPSLQFLIPVTDRSAADRGTHVFGGLGASFLFGK